MKYNPSDAKSLNLPPGEYDAELVSCEEKQSKKGQEMAVLKWRIFPDNDHPPVLITDWIVLEGEFNGLWKIKKMAKAWGKLAQFEDATFNPVDHVGSSIRVKLKIKPSDGKYPESNAIADYKPLSGQPAERSAIKNALREQAVAKVVTPQFAPDESPDDVPF